MKLFISFLILFNATAAYSECKFSTGIRETKAGFLYTEECHIRVGKTVKENKIMKQEIEALNLSLSFTKKALDLSVEKENLWEKEALEQYNNLQNYKKASEKEKWLWFGIGILVMGGATYAAGQLR